jgi:hypothetical protein
MKAGWTEIVHRDEDITDPAEGRRLLESRLAQRGVSMDDLNLSTEVEIRQWLVRGTDGSRSCVFEYLVSDEAL